MPNIGNLIDRCKKILLGTTTSNTTMGSRREVTVETPHTINVFFDGTFNNLYQSPSGASNDNLKEALRIDTAILIARNSDSISNTDKMLEALRKCDIVPETEATDDYPLILDSSDLYTLPRQSAQQSNLDTINKQARLLQLSPQEIKEALTQKSASPQSNVAKMFLDAKQTEFQHNIYISGPGTDSFNRNPFSAMLGVGEQGVQQKTEDAFIAFNHLVSQHNLEGKQIKLNVVGFSRGAAEALYFASLAKKTVNQPTPSFKNKLPFFSDKDTDHYNARNNLVLSPDQIDIGFVGLFDTVSSIGVNELTAGHILTNRNNAEYYGLDIDSNVLGNNGKVVHFIAKNEYRKNFPVKRISKAVSEGVGHEYILPGCHTDIGGAGKANHKQEYSFMIADLMKMCAEQHGGLEFEEQGIINRASKFSEKPELAEMHRKLKGVIAEGRQSYTCDESTVLALNPYINQSHSSMSFDPVNGARYNDGGGLEREYIN